MKLHRQSGFGELLGIRLANQLGYKLLNQIGCLFFEWERERDRLSALLLDELWEQLVDETN